MERGSGSGSEEFRAAAEEARERLLGRLGDESERLDADLAELSERMLESALRIAEERIDRELERLGEASTALGGDLHRRLEGRQVHLHAIHLVLRDAL